MVRSALAPRPAFGRALPMLNCFHTFFFEPVKNASSAASQPPSESHAMHTRDLVLLLSQKAADHASLSRPQQHQVLQETRAEVDAFAASRQTGGLQSAAKLARLGDKVVAQTLQLGEPSEAAEDFLLSLGFVRPKLESLGQKRSLSRGSVSYAHVRPVTTQAPQLPHDLARAESVSGAHRPSNVLSFQCGDGSVVAIGRHHVQSSGASTIMSMLSGDFADTPNEAGYWELPSLTRCQLTYFKAFCEGKEASLSNLSSNELSAAAAVADYLGCESMEEAIVAQGRQRLILSVTSKCFVDEVTQGLAPMAARFVAQFQTEFEMAYLDPEKPSRLTFEVSLDARDFPEYCEKYSQQWSQAGMRDIDLVLRRTRLQLMRTGHRQVELAAQRPSPYTTTSLIKIAFCTPDSSDVSEPSAVVDDAPSSSATATGYAVRAAVAA